MNKFSRFFFGLIAFVAVGLCAFAVPVAASHSQPEYQDAALHFTQPYASDASDIQLLQPCAVQLASYQFGGSTLEFMLVSSDSDLVPAAQFSAGSAMSYGQGLMMASHGDPLELRLLARNRDSRLATQPFTHAERIAVGDGAAPAIGLSKPLGVVSIY